MTEIIEMVQVLLDMRTDTYLQCKYTMLAVSADNPNLADFTKRLFRLTDRRRPLLIGMKGGI